ncbi:MAG: translocation/assembly module TamB domain-containing protein [Pararhodobacter sp.]
MAAAASVLLAMMLAVGPGASQEDDVGVLARVLQDVLSDAGRDVRIRGFEGALSSRATVRELTIADDDGVWIVLSDVVLDWNRAALFDRRVEVNELSARHIDLLRIPSTQDDGALPSPTAREPFRLPELPVSVDIGLVRAGTVRLAAEVTGQEAEVVLQGSLHLAAGAGRADFDAHRTDGRLGAFRLIGDFDNATRFLTLDLSLAEGEGGIASTLLGVPGAPALGLTVRGAGPITTFAADLALETGDRDVITGRFALRDDTPDTDVLQGGAFDIDLSGDLRPLLTQELHPFFGAQSEFHATGRRSDTGEIDLSELAITTGAMHVTGAAQIGSDGFPRHVQLYAAIAERNGQPVLLPGTSGQAFINGATLTIEHDAAVSRDWTMRAELSGLDLGAMDIDSAVLEASGRLNPQAGITTPDAPFEGVFEFLAQGLHADDPAMQQAIGSEFFGLASLEWPGPGQPIQLNGLAFEGDTVSLTAHGDIEGLAFNGFSEFAVPRVEAFSGIADRPLGGQALVTMSGRIDAYTGAFDIVADLVTQDLSLGLPEADALLAGRAGISLNAMRDIEGTVLRALEVSAGTIDLSASGTIMPQDADLRAQLMASDLSVLGEGYGGRLALDVRYDRWDAEQRLLFDGSAIDIALGDQPGSGLARAFLAGANRVRGEVLQDGEITRVRRFSLAGPSLGLEIAGIWHPVTPDLSVTLSQIDLSALGGAASGVVRGRAHLGEGQGGNRVLSVSLAGDGPLRTGSSVADGLLSGRLSADLGVVLYADGGLRIENADLVTGGMTLTARGAQGADGALQLALDAALDSLGRVLPEARGPATMTATVARPAGAAGYDVALQLAGPAAMAMGLTGRVHDDFTLDLTGQGQFDASFINPMIEPANVQGRVGYDIELRGPAGFEALRVNARTSGARYVMPVSGVAFENIAARASLQGARARVSVEGDSVSGGRGALEGTIILNAARTADLSVRVDELIVAQENLFEASVTGAVSLRGALAQGALVQGDVTVNQAEIRIPSSPLARQGVRLNGLTHVGEDSATRQTRVAAGILRGTRHGRAPVPLRLDLTLRAPGRVFVRGRGLDAELGGTLRLGGTTRDVVPAGSFGLVRGRLDLLGNRFTLTDGSASLIGSFVPIVSLTATTESDGVMTSVTLSGEADNPEIAFSSVPELPEDEVLARLIFRRSLQSLSPFQAAQLALSVATLTGRAENSVLSRTRQAMGLDDLDFTVDDAGNTALRFGRYLTEEVYTDLSVDSAGRGEVTINLDLSPSVTLRGRTDTDGRSAVGLFFERDY